MPGKEKQQEAVSALRYLDSLIRSKDYGLARKVVNRLISVDPNCADYYRKLIAVEEAQGRFVTSLLIYPKLVELTQDMGDQLKWFRRLYDVRDFDIILGHFDRLWPELQQRSLEQPPCVDVWILGLRSALKMKALNQFDRYAKHLEILRRKKCAFYQLRAARLLVQQNPKDAIPVLEEGVLLFPGVLSLRLLLGLSYYAVNDLPKAEPHFWKALKHGSALAFCYLVEICPNNKELYQILGAIPVSKNA